jgi:hypothetical protein
VDQAVFGYRVTNSLLWVLVAIGLLLLQLFVHVTLNGQVAHIFPSDGCGQIFDINLKNRLDLLRSIAEISSVLFSILLVFSKNSVVWRMTLMLSGVTTIIGLFTFGWIIWQHKESLISCDIFFMAGSADSWNVATAIMVFLIAGYRLKYEMRAA